VLAQPQNLLGGHLVLTVIPGRIAGLHLADGCDPRGIHLNALPISSGDILDLRDIEQGLENLKRLPTVQADIEITPAESADGADAASDLMIQYRQAFPLRFSSSLDDGGSRATGRYQAGATLAYDNWWGVNDLFYLSLNRSLGRYGDRGSHGFALHYSVPWGYWMFSATMSGSRYHQTVAGAFEPIVYSGRSETTELKLSRLVHRDDRSKTSLFVKGLLRTSSNAIDDATLESQQRSMTAWEAGLGHRHFLASAVAELNLSYRRALDRQGPEPADEWQLPQIATRYGLWLADASLNVPFSLGTAKLRYTATGRAQWNRQALPPQDQFSIGGRYSVRGFDGDLSLQAERGWFLRNELALALGENGQELYGGLDTGQVSGPSAQWLTGQRLSGAAIGLRGSLSRLSYDLFVAVPLARPEGFATAPVTGGFNLQWNF